MIMWHTYYILHPNETKESAARRFVGVCIHVKENPDKLTYILRVDPLKRSLSSNYYGFCERCYRDKIDKNDTGRELELEMSFNIDAWLKKQREEEELSREEEEKRRKKERKLLQEMLRLIMLHRERERDYSNSREMER
jgi:hypothetical protein